MAGGSLNLGDITLQAQAGGFSNWFVIPLLPLFLVYLDIRCGRDQSSAV